MKAPEDDFDPYRILGVPVGASPSDIKQAYRRLVRRYHPDESRLQDAHEKFVRLARAYQILSDPAARADWDRRAGYQFSPEEVSVGPHPAERVPVPDLLAAAERALREGRLQRAKVLCAEALERNPLNPDVYVLLGDVFRAGGKEEIARDMYAEARRLGRTARTPAAPRTPVDREPTARPVTAPAVRWRLVMGASALVAVSLYVPLRLGPPPEGRFPWAAIVTGLVDALLLGASLVAAGVLRSFDDELVAETAGIGSQELPLGLLLGVAGLVWPPVAFALYLAVGWFMGSLSKSVLLVFATTAVLAGIAALFAGDAAWRVFFPGVNVLYFGVLAGWAVGDAFRPGRWWE